MFMLYHYGYTVIPDVNNNITYNGRSNVLLNANLGMSLEDIKKVICQVVGWNYNDVEVDITLKCHVMEYLYYSIPILYDVSFGTIIELFIRCGLNMTELYVGSQPK